MCGANSDGVRLNQRTGLLECNCLDGYVPSAFADSDGVFQCEVFYSRCYPNGTKNWEPNVAYTSCDCVQGYTGDSCELAAEGETVDSSNTFFSAVNIGIISGTISLVVLLGAWLYYSNNKTRANKDYRALPQERSQT
jgi:hypothetical protein